MSLKKWKNEFTKREFVNLLHAVANKNMRDFDYTKKPYIVEKKLSGDALMCFYGDGKFTAVAYDYAKFKRKMGQCDYPNQYSTTVQIMTHEMRHYYQHRQMMASTPIENERTINDWKENRVIKSRGIEKTKDYEYWFSARELDANLYSYLFTLEHCNRASLISICNKKHFSALKRLYKQNGGKKTRIFFSNKVKKVVEN